MAYSHVTYTGNGTTTDYTYSFGYISTSHIKVTVNGTTTTAYSWLSPTVIRFTTAPANAAVIIISRSTSPGTKIVTFDTGTTMTKTVMETDSKQAFYLCQETIDNENNNLLKDTQDGKWNAGGSVIKNVGTPTVDTDAATKKYADDRAAAMVIAASAGTVVGQSVTVVGNIATWANATGTQITDSGTSLATALSPYVQGTGTMVAGNLPKVNANRIVEDSGVAAANLVTSANAATAANQVMLANATSSRAAKFLANGSNDQLLTIVSGVPTWKSPSATANNGLVLLYNSGVAVTNDFSLNSIYTAWLVIGRVDTTTQLTVRAHLVSGGTIVGTHGVLFNSTTQASATVVATSALSVNYIGGTSTGVPMDRGFTMTLTGASGSKWSSWGEYTSYVPDPQGGSFWGSSSANVTANTLRLVFSGVPTVSGEIRVYGYSTS